MRNRARYRCHRRSVQTARRAPYIGHTPVQRICTLTVSDGFRVPAATRLISVISISATTLAGATLARERLPSIQARKRIRAIRCIQGMVPVCVACKVVLSRHHIPIVRTRCTDTIPPPAQSPSPPTPNHTQAAPPSPGLPPTPTTGYTSIMWDTWEARAPHPYHQPPRPTTPATHTDTGGAMAGTHTHSR